ncbi:MAG: tRNA (adenine-N1)-methyltransferase [Actinomycetota bacterium]
MADVSLTGPFRAGEQVLFIDRKDRRYLVVLQQGGSFQTHAGLVPHDEVIGSPEGTEFGSSGSARFHVFRPTLADLVLKQPRGAQVIYPKDLGPMLMLADIEPGARVFETGLGSGALSATLLRAGAHIVGYELRDDFAQRARQNVERALGPAALDRYEVHIRDAYERIDHTGFDRILLDLPEPWQVVEGLTPEVLHPGGILVAYTPSVTQVMRLHRALDAAGFAMTETVEIMQRTWHVEGQAVRPDHRMVAHTGFLTHGRYRGGTA